MYFYLCVWINLYNNNKDSLEISIYHLVQRNWKNYNVQFSLFSSSFFRTRSWTRILCWSLRTEGQQDWLYPTYPDSQPLSCQSSFSVDITPDIVGHVTPLNTKQIKDCCKEKRTWEKLPVWTYLFYNTFAFVSVYLDCFYL